MVLVQSVRCPKCGYGTLVKVRRDDFCWFSETFVDCEACGETFVVKFEMSCKTTVFILVEAPEK